MRQIDFSRLRLTGLIMIRNVYNQLSSRPPRHLEVVCLENVLEFEDRVDNRDHAPWIESPASEPSTHKDAYKHRGRRWRTFGDNVAQRLHVILSSGGSQLTTFGNRQKPR